MITALHNQPILWENQSGPGGATNTDRGLTRSSDLTREGLALQPTRACAIDGCHRPRRKREWCGTHYARWRLHGDPMTVLSTVTDHPPCVVDGCALRASSKRPMCRAHERAADTDGPHGLPVYFADKIAFGADDECWPWLRHVCSTTGYGQVNWLGRPQPAHRVIYRLLRGEIPDGLHIDHVWALGCRRRDCVNPAHMEPVPQGENNRRANEIGGPGPRRTCKRGHDWTEFPPQLAHRSNGTVTRTCSVCQRERGAKRRAARPAATA